MHLIRALFHFGLSGGGATAWNQMQLKKLLRKPSETGKTSHTFSVIYHTLLYSKFLSYAVWYQVLCAQESS